MLLLTIEPKLESKRLPALSGICEMRWISLEEWVAPRMKVLVLTNSSRMTTSIRSSVVSPRSHLSFKTTLATRARMP